MIKTFEQRGIILRKQIESNIFTKEEKIIFCITFYFKESDIALKKFSLDLIRNIMEWNDYDITHYLEVFHENGFIIDINELTKVTCWEV